MHQHSDTLLPHGHNHPDQMANETHASDYYDTGFDVMSYCFMNFFFKLKPLINIISKTLLSVIQFAGDRCVTQSVRPL